MTPYLDDGDVVLHLGDCVEVMAAMAPESVDALVCDPPYGLSGEPDVAEVLRHWLAGDDYHHRGGGFMGRTWDSFVPGPAVWRECLRVLRPGGHLLAFGGTRTYDLQTVAIRLAGFEIRDSIGNGRLGGDAMEAHPGPLAWLYGSGFPKSLDVSKSIDKAAGAEREVVGTERSPFRMADPKMGNSLQSTQSGDTRSVDGDGYIIREITAPATPEAAAWQGWGTALKPAWEPIVVARKPLAGTVAGNVLAHGTGALNVDGCRVGDGGQLRWSKPRDLGYHGGTDEDGAEAESNPAGRWPANVVLSHTPECREVGTRKVKNPGGVPSRTTPKNSSPTFTSDGYTADVHHFDPDGTETVAAWECHPECPVRRLDEEVGERDSHGTSFGMRHSGRHAGIADLGPNPGGVDVPRGFTDTGGPSRFFPTFPADEEGGTSIISHLSEIDDPTDRTGTILRRRPSGSSRVFYTAKASSAERDGATHPTVKPLALMRWLVRLVTPPGGVVLDPFAGSGTTLLAARDEGFRAIGIEREAEYAAMAAHRLRQLSLLGGVA